MGQSYRELVAWQKAMNFVMDVYGVTKTFPRDEVYNLAVSLRRSTVAIPTNIADGQHDFHPTTSSIFWSGRELPWSKSKLN